MILLTEAKETADILREYRDFMVDITNDNRPCVDGKEDSKDPRIVRIKEGIAENETLIARIDACLEELGES